jgi:small conductance mechanosensitive channel
MVSVDLSAWQLLAMSALYAAIIFAAGWFLGKFVRSFVLRFARARKLDEAIVRFLASMAQYLILAAALIAALERVGVQTTSLVALLGTAGLAVGLALQGDLSNFASGIMLLANRPFDIGDVISAGGNTGRVIDIGLLATRLTTPDMRVIIVPNSSITGNTIINMTPERRRRGGVTVGVAYGSSVDQVIEVLLAAAGRVEQALADPAPSVTFDNLGASSLDFTVFASSSIEQYGAMMRALRTAVYDDLNAAGIEIPFAQIVLHTAPSES